METNNHSIASEHISTAFKYAGISFIAGAVNHGFFSETRSIYTALMGIGFFTIGTFLDLKKNSHKNLAREFIVGAIFSIGLGFFTGGLQHFPDSPSRSLWVVPTGFVLSFLALMGLKNSKKIKSDYTYGLVSSLAVFFICFGIYKYITVNGLEVAHDHSSHDHGESVQVENDINPATTLDSPKETKSDVPAKKAHHHAPGTKPHKD